MPFWSFPFGLNAILFLEMLENRGWGHKKFILTCNPALTLPESSVTVVAQQENKIVHIHLETQTKSQMVCIIDSASLAIKPINTFLVIIRAN